MRFVRKCMMIALLIVSSYCIVSSQAIAEVLIYRAARAVFVAPNRDAVMVTEAGGDIAQERVEQLRELSERVLAILYQELHFSPTRSMRIVVDSNMGLQGISGQYQLGHVTIAGDNSSEDDLYGILLHELSHLAVDYLAHGNYPAWLTEGIAVYLEIKHAGATWFDVDAKRAWNSIDGLDKALLSTDVEVQAAAYWQSYALVSYLYEVGGADSIMLLLSRLGQGEAVANAMWRTYGIELAELEREALVSFVARQEAVE